MQAFKDLLSSYYGRFKLLIRFLAGDSFYPAQFLMLLLHLCRYSIQEGVHQPYEDAVASLRLYKKMRSVDHQPEYPIGRIGAHLADIFDGRSYKELENMNPEELIKFSRSNYRCWCLDLQRG